MSISRPPSDESPARRGARLPSHAFEQIAGRHFQRPSEFDDGVDPGDADAALKLADLGAVKRREEAKLFLGEIGPPAGEQDVLAETAGDLVAVFVGGHQDTSRAAK
jgi:hypothetical protein